jgi:hypothetical protein
MKVLMPEKGGIWHVLWYHSAKASRSAANTSPEPLEVRWNERDRG